MSKNSQNILNNKIVFINGVEKNICNLNLHKEYAFICSLKGLYKSGVLKNYSKRKNHFSYKIGCSSKTLTRRIKKLEELNWVYFENNHLFIRSWENITQLIKGEYALNRDGKKKIRRKSFEVKDKRQAVDTISLEIIKSNILSQRSKITESITESSTDHKSDTKILKNQGIIALKMEHIRRNAELKKNGKRTFKVTNLDTNLSRNGIARELGISKSAAQNLIKRLISYGWIKEEVRYGMIEYVPGDTFAKKANFKKAKGVFYKNGILFKKLTSKLTILNDDEFNSKVQCQKSLERFSERTIKKVERLYNNLLARQELLLSLDNKFRSVEDFFQSFCGKKTWGREESIAFRKDIEKSYGKSPLDEKELYPVFNSLNDKNNYLISLRGC